MKNQIQKIHGAGLRAIAGLAATAALFVARLRQATAWQAGRAEFLCANLAEGIHKNALAKKTDAAITTRYLLVKQGTDADHIALCGAGDLPIGPCSDEAAAAEENVAVQFLGATAETRRVVASEAIAANAEVYTAASGKVQDEPVVAGTYFKVGIARLAAAADGDVIEIDPCEPIRLVVIAALGNTNNEIGGLTISAVYDQAEVTALRDKTEELADDVRALQAALTSGKVVTIAA